MPVSLERLLRMREEHRAARAKEREEFRRKYGVTKVQMMESGLDEYERNAYRRLREMSMNNSDYTSGRELFLQLDSDGSPRKNREARMIGEALNERGGFTMMQRVGETFAEFCKEYADEHPERSIIQTDGRDLEHCWDGIGNWKS
jgi:hypothetical protein